MLTRRQIRVKTMQTVYAQCNGNPYSLAQGRAQIKNSCQQIEQLYFLNLALLKALWDFASQQNQIQKKRKSDTPVNPDFELVEALLPLAFIAQHPKVYELIEKNKINFWEIEFEFVQGLFNQLVATQSFLNYKSLL